MWVESQESPSMSREENRAMAPDLPARARLIVEASELSTGLRCEAIEALQRC